MKSVLNGLKDLVYTIRLNSDRLLAAATVFFAILLGAYIATLLFPF